MDRDKVIEDLKGVVDAASILIEKMKSFHEAYHLEEKNMEKLAEEDEDFQSLGGELRGMLEEISI